MKRIFLLIFPLLLVCGNAEAAKKPQLARSLWFLLEKQDKLDKQPNDSVIVTYKVVHGHAYPKLSGYDSWPIPTIVMTIKNNSERTIYVDLQKSFAVINQETYPLYVSSSEVQTSSNTSITGVNLGIVGVGSAGTTSNTKIVHAERFITVPGETKKSLDIPLSKWNTPLKLSEVPGEITFQAGESSDPNDRNYTPPIPKINQSFINNGQVLHYDDDENPLTLDMRLCFSFSEDMSASLVNRAVYYTKHVIGTDFMSGGDFRISVADKRAHELFPDLDSYNAAPKRIFFHIWTYYKQNTSALSTLLGAQQ